MTAKRVLVAGAVLAALLGACASEPAGPSDDQGAGEAAPDFTLALADGGEFRLSAEQRATFLVFWAEW